MKEYSILPQISWTRALTLDAVKCRTEDTDFDSGGGRHLPLCKKYSLYILSVANREIIELR